MQLAIDKAKEGTDLRLGGMNEFREQQNRERSEFAKREEVALQIKPIIEQLKTITDQMNYDKGRDKTVYTIALSGIALIGVAVDLLLRLTGR